MPKLLYIESSPRKERSSSIAVAKDFLATYAAAHPEDAIETLDLWSLPLREFDGDVLDAKYAVMRGQKHTATQAEAWHHVVATFRQFAAADKYLLSLPMWNFGIPYKLKHYVDVITQPGLAFSFSPTSGYKGLVVGKPIAVIYARGGAYPVGTPGEAFDLQKRYIDLWLGFIGFSDIRSIVVEPTVGPSDQTEPAQSAAKDLARTFALTF